jgi:hypothetical protein
MREWLDAQKVETPVDPTDISATTKRDFAAGQEIVNNLTDTAPETEGLAVS